MYPGVTEKFLAITMDAYTQHIEHAIVAQSMSITPDGKWAVSGCSDKTLRVWDLERGECLKTMEGYVGGASSEVTPDGIMVISANLDQVQVWNLERGECLRSFKWKASWVEKTFAVLPDGKRIVVGRDNNVCVWDLKSGECLRNMGGHTGDVYTVGLTPDKNRVISGSFDKTLRVWDLDSGETIAISHAGSRVFSVSNIRPSGNVVYGTDFGDVVILTLNNLFMDCPSSTPVRIWLYGTHGKGGQWDNNISSVCQWCGKRFQVPDKIIDLISTINRNAGLSPGQSPCFELPDDAWDEPKLLSECPFCHKPLRFNPFIVDKPL